MANITMTSQDAMSAKEAECYVKIDNRRYNMMNMIDFTANFEVKSTKVPILGKTGQGNKSTGWSGTWSATCHYNVSIMRELALKYKNTGVETFFEIQVTNEDPTTSLGRQTVVFQNARLDKMILAKFDASKDDYLDEDMSGTFDDFEMPEEFALLLGM